MTPSKDDLLAYAVVLLVLAAVAVAGFFLMRPSLSKIWKALQMPALSAEAVPVGTPADYQWEVETLEGKKIPVSSFKGKVVFLNFWASWCGPCKIEMPSIEKLYGQFKDKDVVFLLVSNEKSADLAAFARKKQLTVPIYSVSKTPEFFHVRGLPTTVILSRSGTVAQSRVGAKRWDKKQTIDLLNKLLEDTVERRGTAGSPGTAG